MADAFIESTIKGGLQTGQPVTLDSTVFNKAASAVPAQPIPESQPSTGLDPQVVALAKAVRQQESGNDPTRRGASGEFGYYQYLPSTWDKQAAAAGVNVPLDQATPEQQNQVWYTWAKAQKDAGYNIGQIASMQNAGEGEPNAYLGTFSNGKPATGTNEYGVKYDVPAYAKAVATNYHQFLASGDSTPSPAPSQNIPTADQSPSIGGFAQNALKSGASLLGGVGEAILHPIQTAQNVGGAVVGGLEKAAGETTDNTAKFDSLINYFGNRYGSIQNFEKTLYEDPVGVAADISTVLGVGGGAAKLAGTAGKLEGLADAGKALSSVSDVVNPLTPVAKGVGKLAQPALDAAASTVGKLAGFEPATINAIRENPSAFSPEQVASVTRQAVGDEVKSALDERLASLNDKGPAYAAIRAREETVPVAHDFLDNQFRSLGLDVKDGRLAATSESDIRAGSEVNKLQDIYNLYKPSFQKGEISPSEFLNLRQDLRDVAYNELGKKSTRVAQATDKIAYNLNKEYRGKIPGLDALDEKFSKEISDYNTLKKGLINKEGGLTDNAYSLIANAANPSNASRLARLEQVVPGITQKLKVLKAIEDIQRSMGTKVGTYGRSILEAGGVIGGLASGQVGVIATGIAAAIITKPENAVQILRAAAKIDSKIVPIVLARLARYATIGSVASTATSGSQPTVSADQQSQSQSQTGFPSASGISASQESGSQNLYPTQTLEDLATAHNFDLQGARDSGYSDPEIQAYLESNPVSK